MKTNARILALAAMLFVAVLSHGSVVFFDGFNTSDGNLVGYNSWAQTLSTATSPIQVNNQAVVLGSSGQDANHAATITGTAGTSFYIGISINISAAQANGDYFLHTASSAGSSTHGSRIYIKSSGVGFVLGVGANNGATTYGSTVLDLGTMYRVVFRYDFISGTGNDSMVAYVSPGSLTEGNNSVYASITATSGSDISGVGVVNFRQGTAGDAPTLTLDGLTVATTFGEVVPVPEPTNIALGIFAVGLLAFSGVRAWRKKLKSADH